MKKMDKAKSGFKRKTISLMVAVLVTVFFSSAFPVYFVEASSIDNMKIHALYLNKVTGESKGDEYDNAGGDSVLIESAGEYLLMDSGFAKTYTSYLKPYLDKTVGDEGELDIYLSHYHIDHYEALYNVVNDYNIRNVYLPDYNYIATILKSENKNTHDKLVDAVKENNPDAEIVLLKKGSEFTLGAADFEVLGPPDVIKNSNGKSISLSSFKNDDYGTKEGHYLNNYSLVTKVTVGSMSYLTTGDIEKEAEATMLKDSGTKSKLKSNIMKLCHHGILGTSNTEKFIAAVKPTYSFAMNSGESTYFKSSSSSDKRKYLKTHGVRKLLSQYGFCYITGDQQKNFVLSVKNDKIIMYENSKGMTNEKKLEKWVTLKGGHGKYNSTAKRITVDKYYINPVTGKPLTGVQKIGSYSYYLGKGGRLEYGYYNAKSVYNAYRKLNGGMMYIRSSGVMTTGFKKIKTRLYYFKPSTGTLKKGSKKWKIYKIENKKYAINQNGVIFNKGWKKYKVKGKNKYRYFSKKTGVMYTGKKKIGGKTYKFKKNGYCKNK